MIRAKELLIFIVFIFAAHASGILFGLYWTLKGYDIAMHVFGGAWIALFSLYLLGKRVPVFDITKHKGMTFFIVLGFAALAGVLWEFYEYLGDVFILDKYPFMAQQGGVFDTLKDLFNDLLGALLGAWISLSIFIKDREKASRIQ